MESASVLLPLAQSIADAKGWDSATRAVMMAGKTLSTVPPESRNDGNSVPGCESPVWLDTENLDGKLQFIAYSPSKIIRGVLAVLLERANTLNDSERQSFDFAAYMEKCQLQRHLSQSRGNGIQGVIKRIQSV